MILQRKSPTVNRTPALLLCALTFSLGGCPLLQIEADVPEVCVSRTGVEVPGALGQLQTTVSVQLSDIQGLDELQAGDELHFISFAAHPQDGGDEFRQVQSAKVTLKASAAAGLPPIEIFACDGDCADAAGSLAVKSSTDANIADYLSDGEATAEVELRGALPLRNFNVDITACLAGELKRSL